MRLPATRSTLIVLGAIAVLGFLCIDDYVPRFGIVWNAMRRDISLGDYAFPYRWLLAACVVAAAARLLVASKASEASQD
jgi:hypothetical protein